jgi:hypothetical protein
VLVEVGTPCVATAVDETTTLVAVDSVAVAEVTVEMGREVVGMTSEMVLLMGMVATVVNVVKATVPVRVASLRPAVRRPVVERFWMEMVEVMGATLEGRDESAVWTRGAVKVTAMTACDASAARRTW